ncbi:unnamed protein product [Chironomus riparius]|uniref:O-acyltransferase WSD1 C-terminal domain-containing protein n=1 Tax=Chironomus riparius TaxID=315576 RepID=A0A9N9RJH8_9DIPT|nr:unnamed protein product [Chironomus riparius]
MYINLSLSINYSFPVVTIYHKLRLFILTKRFRYLDFARSNTIRTLVDTSHNNGILHFIVKIKGKCDIEEIRSAYQKHLLDKRDKNGKFLYPRLKTILISCWGNYAFIKNFDNFFIENHILMGPTDYKGNPIDDSNIQKCMSLIVSKYMNSEYPPWQIKVIPMSDDSAYYLMIRIHHLILDEQRNLKLGDMMLLDRSRGMKIEYSIPKEDKYLAYTPLEKIIRPAVGLRTIYEDITDATISRWNEFVMKHDSLDHHDGFAKCPQNLYDLVSSIVMTIFNTYIDYNRKSSKILKGSTDPQLHLRFLSDLISTECERRQLTFKLVVNLILKALNPVNVAKSTGLFILRTICIWIFLSPFYILRELNALRRYLFLNEEINSNSYIGFFLKYIPLSFKSFKECLYFASICFTAPRMLIEELFSSINDDGHYLNPALCGRKLVSWSDTIPVERLHAKAKKNRQSYSEVMFSTISSCLLDFFEQIKEEGQSVKIPPYIRVNFRSVPFSYLYGVSCLRNGVIGFKLPVNEPSFSQFADIRDQLIETRKHQVMIYLLSLIQIRFDFLTTVIPSMYLKLLINYLSKKFAISVTLCMGINEYEPSKMITCYEGDIEDVIFFRTPQSNNSTNITIQRFKQNVRMNIMCDSNIDKQHYISKNFKKAFQKVPVVKKV